MTTAKKLTACPTCEVTGPAVYVAESHPIQCSWMMNNMHRCGQHDELLWPSEQECPAPSAPEEQPDPHGRLA